MALTGQPWSAIAGLGFREGLGHSARPMQLIRDIYAAKRTAGKPVISFEFFPPKTDEGDKALLEKHSSGQIDAEAVVRRMGELLSSAA